MKILRRAVAVATVGLLSVVLAAPSASASTAGSIYQLPTPYSNSYAFDPGCPNVSLSVVGRVHGIDTLFNLAGSHGQAFLDLQSYSYKERWTNTKNGKWFTIQGAGIYQEVSGTFVPKKDVPKNLIPPEGLVGPIYLFTSQDTGIQFWLKDSAGNTILRDRGVLVFKRLLDTLGDHAPSGTTLDLRIVKVIGPHPSMTADICAVADKLVG
jgi:hypothetical protein